MSPDPIQELEGNTILQAEGRTVEAVPENGVAGNGSAENGAVRASNGSSRGGRSVTSTQAAMPEGSPLSGSPLPMGASAKGKHAARNVPGRSLPVTQETAEDEIQDDAMSGGQRALHALKQALPMVQKLLPLIDGNVLAVVSNLLAPRPQAAQKVNLAPIESHMTEIQLLQHDLRSQVTEHNTSLKRVEDQLEMVKEATDRNTLEQQELIEDLRAISNRVNLFAILLVGLLALSLILNLVLFMHVRQVLP